jgi:hypothetical protein
MFFKFYLLMLSLSKYSRCYVVLVNVNLKALGDVCYLHSTCIFYIFLVLVHKVNNDFSIIYTPSILVYYHDTQSKKNV